MINNDLIDDLNKSFDIIINTIKSDDKNLIACNDTISILMKTMFILDDKSSDLLISCLHCLSSALGVSCIIYLFSGNKKTRR